MTEEQILSLFTRSDGTYLFARWGRPIVPVVFGVEDETLKVVKGAIEAVVVLAGHQMDNTDPELGANFMIFFIRDWSELSQTPGLDRLIPELGGLIPRLEATDANQYRFFRFDADGGIKTCFAFVRMDTELARTSADLLSLNQAVRAILLWSDRAFKDRPAFARAQGGATILRPDIAEVIRAAYDPVMPVVATDPAHALRLAARLSRTRPI